MKKIAVFAFCAALLFGLAACAPKEYSVEIADNYPIVKELKESYLPGETVTIQLGTVTEQFYVLLVNGVSLYMDLDSSDIMYSYFTFTMPNEDVLIEIIERSVDIPDTPPE